MKRIRKIAKKLLIQGEIVKHVFLLLFFKERFVIFDTPSHENIGDQAILLAEIDFLSRISSKKKVVCIPAECTENIIRCFSWLLKKDKVVFVHGGGFLGSIWKDEIYPQIIKSNQRKQIIIFPQTIYYENDKYGREKFDSEKDLFDRENVKTFVREVQSKDFMLEKMVLNFPGNCILVPDIVLAYNTDIKHVPNEIVVTCFRKDKEKTTTDSLMSNLGELISEHHFQWYKTDMCVDHALWTFKAKRNAVQEKLRQFASAKFVVTDRLHCMIFCTLVGTPCIAMDNSSKKVKGVYEKWLKDLDYIVFCENENDALSKAQEWIKADSIKATRYSPKDLESAFAPLTQVIKDCLA